MPTYVVFLTVDGKDAGNRIINHPARTQDLTILSISDIRVSHNAVRPLRFWNVRLIGTYGSLAALPLCGAALACLYHS